MKLLIPSLNKEVVIPDGYTVPLSGKVKQGDRIFKDNKFVLAHPILFGEPVKTFACVIRREK